MNNGFWFHDRLGDGAAHPAGITVSKRQKLPDGDFRITEYCWGGVSLWFVDGDAFTDDERQEAYVAALEQSLAALPSHPRRWR